MTKTQTRLVEPHGLRWLSAFLLAALAPSLFACQIQVESPPDTPGQPSSFDDHAEWTDPFSNDQGGPYGSDLVEPDPDYPEARSAPDAEQNEEPWMQYRELIAIDPDLVSGPLASNADPDAPLSFRAQMQWLAASTRDPLVFVRSWLDQWLEVASVGPALAPVSAREGARSLLIESWLGPRDGAALESGTSPDAGYAAPPFSPSWAEAPFRLIAIVNRVDLATDPCSGFGGELRYVYTAVDIASGQPLDMTAIVEIPYPTLRPAVDWARTWDEVGRAAPGADHASAIESLAREVQREADPLRVRIRTNEQALGDLLAPSWEMREFQVQVLGDELALSQVPLASTPRADVDSAALAAHVISHSDEILAGAVPLPPELQAGAAPIPTADFSWRVLGVSERLRRAFSLETCNGCHGGDTATMPFRHVAPGATPRRRARLSRLLYDPASSTDELRRRSAILAELAGASCPTREPTSLYPSEGE